MVDEWRSRWTGRERGGRDPGEWAEVVLDGEIDGDAPLAAARTPAEQAQFVEASATPEALERDDDGLRSHSAGQGVSSRRKMSVPARATRRRAARIRIWIREAKDGFLGAPQGGRPRAWRAVRKGFLKRRLYGVPASGGQRRAGWIDAGGYGIRSRSAAGKALIPGFLRGKPSRRSVMMRERIPLQNRLRLPLLGLAIVALALLVLSEGYRVQVPPWLESVLRLPEPDALPPLLDASGVLAIFAARSLLIPLSLRASYCLSFLTLGP